MDGDEARNLAAQAELYGEPVGDLLRRYGAALSLTQGRLADLLGVSAPMLSQLANGRRVRFGNPVTVQRLQAMDATVREVESGGLAVPDALERLDRNRTSDVFTSTRSLGDEEAARRLAATAGDAADFAAAATLLDASHPRIAALLRTWSPAS